jgi:hypothetical protein
MLRQMADNMFACGLPYEAVLAAMTVSTADLVVWSGDRLEVTSAADQVIIAGKIIEMVASQTLLWGRYLPVKPVMPRAYIKP